MPSLSEKMLVPLLALMMVGDARAADPAKYTSSLELKNTVTLCLRYVSNVGDCCMPSGSVNVIATTNTLKSGTDCNDDYTHLSDWDVSEVTSMKALFKDRNEFNQPLNNWDVSEVTDMKEMFFEATAFDQPLDNWDVSNVRNFQNMFFGAAAFSQSVDMWVRTSDGLPMPTKFTEYDDLKSAVDTCLSNLDLYFWDRSPVGDCCLPEGVWEAGTSSENQDSFVALVNGECPDGSTHLSNWDVSEVTDMWRLFYNRASFNQPLNAWDVSKVTSLQQVFEGAKDFNQPLDSWDVSNVENMFGTFMKAENFNQDLNAWDVSSVTNMNHFINQVTMNPTYNQPPLCGPSWVASTAPQDYMFNNIQGGGIADTACCPAGTYLSDGVSTCTDCAAGKYADQVGQDACTDCAKGKYNDQVGQDACTQCVHGQSTSDAASDESTDCKRWRKLISDQDLISELSTRQGSCNGQ